MMDGAFFVGRKEIMDWVNGTLDMNLPKVEDTASGAVACQLLDIMYPGQGMHALVYHEYLFSEIHSFILRNSTLVCRLTK